MGYQTDALGAYAFEDLQMHKRYSLEVDHQDSDILNGVDILDCLALLNHLVGNAEFDSPYQLIAADMDGDGDVDVTDFDIHYELVTDRRTDLPSGRNWVVFDAGIQFSDPLNPFLENLSSDFDIASLEHEMEKNWMAVKTGDFDGKAKSNFDNQVSTRTYNQVELKAVNQRFNKGELISMSLSSGLVRLSAMDISLDYNPAVLSFAGIDQAPEHMEVIEVEKGTLRIVFLNAEDLDLESLNFNFVARGQGNLKNHLNLAQNRNQLAYDEFGQASTLKLRFEDSHLVSSDLQAQPNPLDKQTTVIYQLNHDSECTFEFIDATGRIIDHIQFYQKAGRHQFVWSPETQGSGIITLRMTTSTHQTVLPLLILD